MKANIFFIIILITVFSFCSQTPKSQQEPEKKQTEIKKTKHKEKPLYNECPPTIKQGIYGCCTYKTGDCMPIIDTNKCKWYGVKRTIYVYEATTEKKTTSIYSTTNPPPTFYSKIKTKLVTQTQSDENGCFQMSLPVGKYSVFILENGKYYCTDLGSNNLLCPVTIETDKVTKRNLLISMFVN